MNFRTLGLVIFSNVVTTFVLVLLQNNFEQQVNDCSNLPQVQLAPVSIRASCPAAPTPLIVNGTASQQRTKATRVVSERRQRTLDRVTAHVQTLQSRIHQYNTTKYLIYSESGTGVGNRFNALISSLLFAIVSNRTLLVQWSEFKDELRPLYPWRIDNFENLFPREWWSAPKEGMLKFECCNPGNKTWLKEIEHRPHFINLDLSEGTIFNELCCHDWVQKYDRYRLITFRSNQYMAPFALYNPHYERFMSALFDGFEPFGILAKSTLIFRPELQAVVDNFKAKHDFDRHFVIGIQIRTELLYRDSANQVKKFFACADQIDRIHREANPDELPTKLFVCSDNQTLIKELKAVHGPKLISLVKEDLPAADLPGLSPWQLPRLADIWLLGETDEMVLSDLSTFGTTASAKEAKIPYVLLLEGLCVQKTQADPCFTYSWALPYQSCFKSSLAYQREWSICQHDYYRQDPYRDDTFQTISV